MNSILILTLISGHVLCLENLEESADYIDPVIDYLLNGGHLDLESTENVEVLGEEPILSDGIWKCGNCTTLDESALIYSEVNEVEDNLELEDNVDIQIGLYFQDMKCITVSSSTSGVVRRVTGSCEGPTVTLNIAPAKRFTIQVYN